jgi:hypothetical protein
MSASLLLEELFEFAKHCSQAVLNLLVGVVCTLQTHTDVVVTRTLYFLHVFRDFLKSSFSFFHSFKDFERTFFKLSD